MDYELSNLVDWTRRHSGDKFATGVEDTTSDGTTRVTIGNTGTILIDSVTVAFATVDEYDVAGSVLTLTEAPNAGDNILVQYRVARYSDAEVLEFLLDAARGVAADMKFKWSVSTVNHRITDLREELFDPETGSAYFEIEQLLVYRAGALLYADKTNQAASDAILIQDDATKIDTSKAATAGEKALKRLFDLYKDAVLRARSEGFMGTASSD
jgi:hypothetical protein